MKVRSFSRFFYDALHSIVRNLGISIASVITIALTLFVCGVFAVIVLNVDSMATQIESQVEIQVYLEDDISENDIDRIESRIRSNNAVTSIDYIPKEEALESMASRFDETVDELEASLGENPLPNSFLVQVNSADDVVPVADIMAGYDGVSSVDYGSDTVKKLFKMLKIVRYFGIGVILLLILASIFIIAFNIKITVDGRRQEIAIMKYVGASNWYIRWPFCITGMLLGFVGGVIAVGVLALAYSAIFDYINELLNFASLVHQNVTFVYIYLSILILGTLLGAFGSLISLRTHLKEKQE